VRRVPRVSPVPRDLDEAVLRSILDQPAVRNSAARNVYLTLAHNPPVLDAWWGFLSNLLRADLPPRRRELLILRASLLWDCDYQWRHHVRVGARAGLGEDELLHVAHGDCGHWDAVERALLRSVDELYESSAISDRTWAVLADAHTVPELLEIPLIVGQYAMLAFLVNGVQIACDGEDAGFTSYRHVVTTWRSRPTEDPDREACS